MRSKSFVNVSNDGFYHKTLAEASLVRRAKVLRAKFTKSAGCSIYALQGQLNHFQTKF